MPSISQPFRPKSSVGGVEAECQTRRRCTLHQSGRQWCTWVAVPPGVLDRINMRRVRHDATFRVRILRAQRSECWHVFISESLPELGADRRSEEHTSELQSPC